MPINPTHAHRTSRRYFLGCAASGLALGAAPVPPEPEEVIPLKTVFSACLQKGMLDVPPNPFVEGDNALKRSLYRAAQIGPANLFLVKSDTIDGAVDTTFTTLLGGTRIDRAVDPYARKKKDEGRSLWAFFYFGAALSSPGEWKPTRVSIQRERILMTVARPDPTARFGVDFSESVYMFWVPLGERKEKAFMLTAFDETNRVTIMSRHVTV